MTEERTASGLPLPPPCDPVIYEKGETVAILDAPSEHAEAWVRAVADVCGVPMDWHYMGGRAVVRALVNTTEDRSVVRSAIEVAPRDHRSISERVDALMNPKLYKSYIGSRVIVLATY